MAVPFRRRGGQVKDRLIRKKVIFFNLKKVMTAIKLEGGGEVRPNSTAINKILVLLLS